MKCTEPSVKQTFTPPGWLLLTVTAPAVPPHNLAEQDGTTIAELRDEVAELMSGVYECDRRGALWRLVAGQNGRAGGRREQVGVETQECRQRPVDFHDLRLSHLGRRDLGKEAARQTAVRVVEGEGHFG